MMLGGIAGWQNEGALWSRRRSCRWRQIRRFIVLTHRKLNSCRTVVRVDFLLIGLAVFLSSAVAVEAQRLWTEQPPGQMALPALRELNDALLDLTERVLPAVISLQVRGKNGAAPNLPRNHPPVPDPSLPITGSGFIIKATGLAITNQHVVEGKEEVYVRLFDGIRTRAKVLGRDTVGDMALLQIESETPLPVVPLGDSDALQVGEMVVAIGSPIGFEHSVTFGIISGKRRNFLNSSAVGGYLQTDAAITTGNSGGPLVNMRGEVVGVNTATIRRGTMGFAIPVNAVKDSLPQLHDYGRVRRAYLGVRIDPIDRDKIIRLGLESPRGAYVHEVLSGQPAQRAGIAIGDIIVGFDGQEVHSPFDLQTAVAASPVGKKVRIEFLRQRQRQTVELALGEMPEN
jgi:serine protease Do